MEYKEYSAKTLDEAITMASVDLGVTSTELHYEVLEKGSGGILGFGRKDVTIKAIRKADLSAEETVVEEEPIVNDSQSDSIVIRQREVKEEVESEKHELRVNQPLSSEEQDRVKNAARAFLNDLFKEMDLVVDIKIDYVEKDNSLAIEFAGDHMGIIIGKRGQTLDSLQYLVNLVVNKQTETYIRIKLDTEDYRKRRKETLENLAKNIAYKVRKSGKPVTLEAMNPYERRTIHYALQKDRYVTTYSEGEEPFRHVVVTIKK